MWQFLQTYGLWIVFAIFFVFMIRMHLGGGMGGMHGGGGKMGGMHGNGGDGMNMDRTQEPSYDNSPDTQRAIPLDNDQQGTVRNITPEGKIVPTDSSSGRHHSHC
jgi:hypothetical protein